MKKMHEIVMGLLIIALAVLILYFAFIDGENKEPDNIVPNGIMLPEAAEESILSFEQALQKRRSVREYSNRELTVAEVSQILWAAQGITGVGGLRTAPSAGALYPLEIYIVAGGVCGLSRGVYHYVPQNHTLVMHREGDIQEDLFSSALDQQAVIDAPAVLVITAVPSRTMQKYGERGLRYVWLEAGHASQNICLQAVTLGLGTVPIGAFNDDKVSELLDLDEGQIPLYLMPVGATS